MSEFLPGEFANADVSFFFFFFLSLRPPDKFWDHRVIFVNFTLIF